MNSDALDEAACRHEDTAEFILQRIQESDQVLAFLRG